MIGLLSSPGAVLAVDEAVARRAASPLENKTDPTPIDAVHQVEAGRSAEDAGARHDQGLQLTTEERLRQDEALHAGHDHAEDEELRRLRERDAEVRRHEQAHMAAAGGLAGPASYTYERGPDGRNYAVAGEVSIDTASEPDPDATIDKMRQVRRAALAPADPSSQDRSVAAKAAQVIRAAEAELAARRHETLLDAAHDVEEARDAAIVDAQEREQQAESGSLADAPRPAAHQVSEYQRQAVLSAGSRLSSQPPPPNGFDSSL